MDTNGTPTTVLWRGELYQVTWGTQDGHPFVEVSSDSLEFREACLRNMRANGNHLTISFDPQGQFLADDELKGQRGDKTE
jgi:hypothetical protein